MTKKPLLAVRDLQVSFRMKEKQLRAVQGVSFSVYEKEIVGIVGESGCGKSAMAKAIVRLLPPHSAIISGGAIYQDKNLFDLTEEEMRAVRGKEIGIIFQDPMTSLNPTMRIGEQILEGYLLHQKKRKTKESIDYAIHLLELVGIPQPDKRFYEYPHTLSGGMRQRVMIAIALAAKPKLIIADEPTTALDVTIQAQILELMRQIKEKTGTSLIFITHDLSVVAGYCDRVLVMYAGKIIENASVDQLFANPSHPYTKGLLKSIPRLDTTRDTPLIPIEGTPPTLTESLAGCAFCDRCSEQLPVCALETPTLKEQTEHHLVACWNQENGNKNATD